MLVISSSNFGCSSAIALPVLGCESIIALSSFAASSLGPWIGASAIDWIGFG